MTSRLDCTSSRTRRGSRGTSSLRARESSDRGADARLDDHRGGTAKAEAAPSGAFGDDDRAEQRWLAGDVAQYSDHEVEIIADGYRGKLPDAPDAEALRRVRAEHRDTVPARPSRSTRRRPRRSEFIAH